MHGERGMMKERKKKKKRNSSRKNWKNALIKGQRYPKSVRRFIKKNMNGGKEHPNSGEK